MSASAAMSIRFRDVAERPVAVAQPRLFRAGHAQRSSRRTASTCVPGPPRQRSVLALAGVQHAADRGADRRLRASAAAASRRTSPPTSPAWPAAIAGDDDAGAGLPRPGAAPCPARPTSPARSAPTSIPTRSSPRARRWPRRSPRPTAALFERLFGGLAGGSALQPGRGERRPAGLRNVAARLSLGRLDGDPTRAAEAISPRPTNMTDRAAALTVLAHRHRRIAPRPAQALAAFETALSRRSAGARQMVPDPGDACPGRRRSSASRR